MATHCRKRKYVFVRSNNTIYSVSFTIGALEEIVKIKKELMEKKDNEVYMEELFSKGNITIRTLRDKYNSIVSDMFPKTETNSFVYVDIPGKIFANNTLYDKHIVKLVVWNGQTQALTNRFDVPMEIHLYKIGTYDAIRVPIEESVYLNLINPEIEPIEFELD